MQRRDAYEQLADLLDYPSADYPARVRATRATLDPRYPEAVAHLDRFADALPDRNAILSDIALNELQEIFTRSFDVQSVTTLGVGYVMFGDDYKRGELLVNLSREQREAGIDCGNELPDHLPNVLRLIARWQDEELVAELVGEIVYPAIEVMIAEFDPQRTRQRESLYEKHFKTLIESSNNRGLIFREPLAAVLCVLQQDFGCPEPKQSVGGRDFLRTIDRELQIERDEGRPQQPRSMP